MLTTPFNCENFNKLLDKAIIELDNNEIERYKGLWANLAFFKDGGSRIGLGRYDSQEKALEANKKFRRGLLAIPLDCTLSKYLPYRKSEYSHSIQIPVT